MAQLNFRQYDFSIMEKDDKRIIFDPVRKRYVALTPEEWVRQNILQYFLHDMSYPAGLVSVEGSISLYRTSKRYDIAVFARDGVPLLVVEVKSPEIHLTQAVVDQAVRYNLVLRAPYLLISNGLAHVVLKREEEGYVQVGELPGYPELADGGGK